MVTKEKLQRTLDMMGFDYDVANDVMIDRNSTFKVKDVLKTLNDFEVEFYSGYTLQDLIYQIMDGFVCTPSKNGVLEFITKKEGDYRKLYVLVK